MIVYIITIMLAPQVQTTPKLALAAALTLDSVYIMQQVWQSSAYVPCHTPHLIFLFCHAEHVSQSPCMAA